MKKIILIKFILIIPFLGNSQIGYHIKASYNHSLKNFPEYFFSSGINLTAGIEKKLSDHIQISSGLKYSLSLVTYHVTINAYQVNDTLESYGGRLRHAHSNVVDFNIPLHASINIYKTKLFTTFGVSVGLNEVMRFVEDVSDLVSDRNLYAGVFKKYQPCFGMHIGLLYMPFKSVGFFINTSTTITRYYQTSYMVYGLKIKINNKNNIKLNL